MDRFLESGRFAELRNGVWEDAPYHKSVRKAQTLLRDYTLKQRRRRHPLVQLARPVAVSPTTVEESVAQPFFDDIELLPAVISGNDTNDSSSTRYSTEEETSNDDDTTTDASTPFSPILIQEENEDFTFHDLSLEMLDFIDDPDQDPILQSIHQDPILQGIDPLNGFPMVDDFDLGLSALFGL